MKGRQALLLTMLAAVILVAAPLAWLTLSQHRVKDFAGPPRQFELIDQDGRAMTEKDLLGKPSAVFFGFTSCPDICPTTLLEMTNWLQALGADADKLNVVFVSVDWERDTPQQMKLYLSSFDPRIRGFTGSEPRIRQITSAFRVYYKRVALRGSDYTYDHSTIIYLMDKNGRSVGGLTYEAPKGEAVAKLRKLTSESLLAKAGK